jgi:hypothetical protein
MAAFSARKIISQADHPKNDEGNVQAVGKIGKQSKS